MTMPARSPAPTAFLRSTLTVVRGYVAIALMASVAAAAPTVEEAIKLEPRQKGVDCDRPTSGEIQGATIKQEKLDGVDALVVRRPDGRVLRAFADTDGNRVVDRWSFFKDGVEVFREMATNPKETKANEARWLNAGGTRWGIDRDGDGVIDTWKVISAEEATAEIIRALRDRDPATFARLLPTRDDLTAAGFAGERLAELTARTTAAREAFTKLAKTQNQVGPKAEWTSMLVPHAPGVLPAGSPGIDRDVTAYDNVVVLVDNGGPDVQLVVGSLVRCGTTWRPIDAPLFAGDDGRLADMPAFFSPMLGAASPGPGISSSDEKIRPLLTKLAELETAMATADASGRRKLAEQNMALLEQVVTATSGADRDFWNRQLVETVAAYVQEGLLPDGLATLERLASEAGDDKELAAFVAFRVIQARYASGMEDPSANFEKLQDTWFSDLATFVETYPTASEASEAMLQLAFRDEFSGRDEEAIGRYQAIATAFPDTPNARKATGAVRRLQCVGKPLDLRSRTVDGKDFSIADLRGGPVLIHFWSTDCEPCKVDLAQIQQLQAKYGSKKFASVGVALDTNRNRLAAFLRERPLPWPQLHEEGGLDSRLAESFGIMVLPTMILLDADGNVVDRNVSITELERKLTSLLEAK
jgi:thiol-disulfide isomerase/thioredoxin